MEIRWVAADEICRDDAESVHSGIPRLHAGQADYRIGETGASLARPWSVTDGRASQVQTILSDHKGQEIWSMMQHMQSLEMVSNRDVMRYRREAERVIGAEDPLYRVEWVRARTDASRSGHG